MSHREQLETAGAYVLGALSPAQREAYAEHLATCPRCQAAVEELAGLPGLLSRVALDDVESLASPTAPVPPAGLLDDLLGAARAELLQRRQRRRVATALVGLAAAVALAATLLLVRPGAPSGSSPVALRPVAATTVPLTATVRLQPVAWGTRLELVCSYDSGAGASTPYALVVSDRTGREEQVATWTALPGRDATMAGSTSVPAEQIASVEVRTVDGRPVLRLDRAAAGGRTTPSTPSTSATPSSQGPAYP